MNEKGTTTENNDDPNCIEEVKIFNEGVKNTAKLTILFYSKAKSKNRELLVPWWNYCELRKLSSDIINNKQK